MMKKGDNRIRKETEGRQERLKGDKKQSWRETSKAEGGKQKKPEDRTKLRGDRQSRTRETREAEGRQEKLKGDKDTGGRQEELKRDRQSR